MTRRRFFTLAAIVCLCAVSLTVLAWNVFTKSDQPPTRGEAAGRSTDDSSTYQPPATSAGPEETDVVTVVPISATGKLVAGYTVIENLRKVTCQSASYVAVDSDIAGCTPFAVSAHVCWVKEDRMSVLCASDPWTTVLIEYATDAPVPNDIDPVSEPTPWALELEEAGTCRAELGSSLTSLPNDLVITYYCDKGAVVTTMGSPVIDESSSMWTVQVVDEKEATAAGDSYELPPRQKVTTAYYAGSETDE